MGRLSSEIAVVSLVIGTTAAAEAQAVNWYASIAGIDGDDQCEAGARDCNPCAYDVEGQFRELLHVGTAQEPALRSRSWWLDRDHSYPPSGRTPSGAFNITYWGYLLSELNELSKHHIQGFIRTYSSEYNYVGSHSDDYHGSIFFINHPNDYNQLSAIYDAYSDHPSGVTLIGQYVAFADGLNRMRLLDIERVPEEHEISYAFPTSELDPRGLHEAQGGLGLARLRMGGHLLLVSDGGGNGIDGTGRGTSRFYYLVGGVERPTAITFLGEWDYTQPRSWSQSYLNTENLSLITECGTGDLYAIHATGHDGIDTSLSAGEGYYRLSRVEWGPEGPKLHVIAAKLFDQDLSWCHLRSSGTAYVHADHSLEFYCHARQVDEREADFGVIKE